MDKAENILKSFLSFYGIEGGEKYVSLFSSWRKIAGEDLAFHSKIIDLRKGVLVVEVDHPGWMQVLQIQQEEILEKLIASYPNLGIRMLHLKLAKDGQFSPPPEPVPDTRQEQNSPPPAKAEPGRPEPGKARDGSPAGNIKDEELKNILLRLKKSLENRKK